MKTSDIVNIRLSNHQLTTANLKSPKELVSWLGAVQAQDFNMAKWAIGVRARTISEKDVEESMNKGEIIRSHILRPTWHCVSAEDYYWMLDLSAKRIRKALDSFSRKEGLDETTIQKHNEIIDSILEKGDNLTRKDLGEMLVDSGVNLDKYGLNHILFYAELDGIVCNGIVKENKPTYGLLRKKLPNRVVLTKEESLYRLAYKYFSSHAPGTLNDFLWWSGLLKSEAKLAIELVKDQFISKTIDSDVYFFNKDQVEVRADNVYLLPAFDEYLVAYKNREHILASEHHKKVIVGPGVFKPTIIKNGQIIGIWNRVVKKDKIIAEPILFEKQNQKIQNLIEEECMRYTTFHNKTILP